MIQTQSQQVASQSHTTCFASTISTCDFNYDRHISLKINWRKRVRVERTGDISDAARRF